MLYTFCSAAKYETKHLYLDSNKTLLKCIFMLSVYKVHVRAFCSSFLRT